MLVLLRFTSATLREFSRLDPIGKENRWTLAARSRTQLAFEQIWFVVASKFRRGAATHPLIWVRQVHFLVPLKLRESRDEL